MQEQVAGADGTRDPRAVALSLDGHGSLERLREIFEVAPIGIGIVDLDGRTILTNDALRQMLGYSEDEFARLHFEAFTHPDDVERNRVLFAEMVAGRSDRFDLDKRFVARDGSVVWGRLTVSLLRDDARRPFLAVGMLENITQRRELEAQLREAEATYRLLVEQVPAVVYVLGLGSDAAWRYVSPQIRSMLGFSAEEWLADRGLWARQMHAEERDEVLGRVAATARSRRARPAVVHYRMQRRDGAEIWVRDEFRVVDDRGGAPVLRGVLLDATREKELEATLEQQASHDGLTGLPNRALFRTRIAQARETLPLLQGHHAAAVYIDLDDFKTVQRQPWARGGRRAPVLDLRADPLLHPPGGHGRASRRRRVRCPPRRPRPP